MQVKEHLIHLQSLFCNPTSCIIQMLVKAYFFETYDQTWNFFCTSKVTLVKEQPEDSLHVAVKNNNFPETFTLHTHFAYFV